MSRRVFVLLTIFFIIGFDQLSKVWVKLNMALGESFSVFGLDWFQINFTENPGMAFGLEFGGEYGKLFLSLFRIIVVGVMIYFLVKLIQRKASKKLLFIASLIIAGASGNIIDSMFYGVIFSDSGTFHAPDVAILFPEGGGYAPFLFGKVVDMLYFPLISGHWPTWVPYVGGDYFIFFQPIFNIADSAISIGVVLALINYRSLNRELESFQMAQQEISIQNEDSVQTKQYSSNLGEEE